MKKKILIGLALLLVQFTFSQRPSRGDQFFKIGDYKNAAIEYTEEIKQNGYSKHLLGNIVTAYYNIFDFEQAAKNLEVLTKEKKNAYDNKYNFMAYQVYSALGEYDKAVDYLDLYYKGKDIANFNKAKALSTIEDFKLKNEDYAIKEADFNSTSSEFGAVKQDSIVYFVTDRKSNSFANRKYRWTHKPFLNIYEIQVDKDNNSVGDAKVFSSEINTKLHEGNFCFTTDGKTMYISKSNSDKGSKKFNKNKNNAIHLYSSVKLNDEEWSDTKKLPFNDTNYTMEHPALSKDESKLYFSSNMPGGFGDYDLYYVDISLGGSSYGTPVNLGPVINTSGREQFPSTDGDGNLFFSSNGHLGLGMMDIFVSQNENEMFKQPLNLGTPVNSNKDDFSLNYYDAKHGFFSSNRGDFKNDQLYVFTQIGEVIPKIEKARFEIRDIETKAFITNTAINLTKAEEVVFKENVTEGAFSVNVTPGSYTISANAGDYLNETQPILITENDKPHIIYLQKESVKYDTKIIAVPVPEKFYFNVAPIYFNYNKWDIRADSKRELDKLAKTLKEQPTIGVSINSYTDSRGTASYNLLLSERRAKSTRDYLITKGVKNPLKVKGYGESKPLIDCTNNCSEKDHQANRRSEFEAFDK